MRTQNSSLNKNERFYDKSSMKFLRNTNWGLYNVRISEKVISF